MLLVAASALAACGGPDYNPKQLAESIGTEADF